MKTIDEIREQWAKDIFTWIHSTGADWNKTSEVVKVGYRKRADQILQLEIVPERECPDCCPRICCDDYYCNNCDGTGKLPPVTVERAIKEKLDG